MIDEVPFSHLFVFHFVDAIYDDEGQGTLKDFIDDGPDDPSVDETDANHTAEQDETGKTALMLAAKEDNLDLVENVINT